MHRYLTIEIASAMGNNLLRATILGLLCVNVISDIWDYQELRITWEKKKERIINIK